jgi:glucose-6-phosphate dehydrogenase assembly protein OpcA
MELAGAADGAEQPQARVLAQCWKPFGKAQQICCEQIEITTDPGGLADLATVLLGLIVPDLPVVLWSRRPGLFDLPEFRLLSPLLDKIILDSDQVKNVPAFLEMLMRTEQCLLADLSWTRITRWRETISSVFESPQLADALCNVNQVAITYAGSAVPTRAWYLAGWFNSCLGRTVKPTLRQVEDEGEPGIRAVSIGGEQVSVSVELTDDSAAVLHAGTVVSRMNFPRPAYHLLLREELNILERDPVFQRTISHSIALLQN